MKYKIVSYMRLIIAILLLGFIIFPGIILDSYIRIGLGVIGFVAFYSAYGLKEKI